MAVRVAAATMAEFCALCTYCTCACSDDCFNPFKRDQEDEDEAEDETAAVDVQEGDEEDEYHAFNSDNSYE